MTKKELKKKKEEVLNAYIEKFGGFPYFLLMGASDQEIINALEPCLKTGKEYTVHDTNNY